jgi:hypothetical protein
MDSITISLDVERHFTEVKKNGKSTSENPILMLSRKSATEELGPSAISSSITNSSGSNDNISRRPSTGNAITRGTKFSNSHNASPSNTLSSRRNIMMDAMKPRRSNDPTGEGSEEVRQNMRPKSAGNTSARASVRKSSQIIEEFDEDD